VAWALLNSPSRGELTGVAERGSLLPAVLLAALSMRGMLRLLLALGAWGGVLARADDLAAVRRRGAAADPRPTGSGLQRPRPPAGACPRDPSNQWANTHPPRSRAPWAVAWYFPSTSFSGALHGWLIPLRRAHGPGARAAGLSPINDLMRHLPRPRAEVATTCSLVPRARLGGRRGHRRETALATCESRARHRNAVLEIGRMPSAVWA
jgi:hypothetical protein